MLLCACCVTRTWRERALGKQFLLYSISCKNEEDFCSIFTLKPTENEWPRLGPTGFGVDTGHSQVNTTAPLKLSTLGSLWSSGTKELESSESQSAMLKAQGHKESRGAFSPLDYEVPSGQSISWTSRRPDASWWLKSQGPEDWRGGRVHLPAWRSLKSQAVFHEIPKVNHNSKIYIKVGWWRYCEIQIWCKREQANFSLNINGLPYYYFFFFF